MTEPKLKDKVDDLSKTLCAMVTSFSTLLGGNLPSPQIREFIKAYEQLYFFQKTNNLSSMLTTPLQKTADFLITQELKSVRQSIERKGNDNSRSKSELIGDIAIQEASAQSVRMKTELSNYQTLPAVKNNDQKTKSVRSLKKQRQIKLYEQAFARDNNMSGFLMSDNFFLKKLTDKLNDSDTSLKQKVQTSTARDPYLTGIDKLVLSNEIRNNIPVIQEKNLKLAQKRHFKKSDNDQLRNKIIKQTELTRMKLNGSL